VQANTTYCGGRATSQIRLASGDTWIGGEVTGVTAGIQQGAVECPSNCTLVNMNVHDNPGAFAGIDLTGGGTKTNVTISGGRVTGSGSLGIGGGGVDGLTIHGVEIDHNGASANCGFEGGGFKGGATHHLHFFSNYVHDNGCSGVWLDINSANNEIDHNRVDNNSQGGIFYEISQDASIHDNEVSGNGHGSGCGWLWNAGIGIASSFNIQVYGNTVSGNCNGIAGTQQNRTDSAPPAHLLANISVHDNRISSSGKTGAVADNGADLTTRNIVFANNSFGAGASLCGLSC
jgi:parallel beta-helix repeat protein